MRISAISKMTIALAALTTLALFAADVSSEDSQFVRSSTGANSKSASSPPKSAPDRILVQMKTSGIQSRLGHAGSFSKAQALSAADSAIRASGLKLGALSDGHAIRALTDEGTTLAVAIDPNQETVESAIARLSQNPEVEWAQPDYVYQKFAVPNDTNYGKLWGLKNSGQVIDVQHRFHNRYRISVGTAGRDMGMETAWDKITDCSSVVVAVLDTGINLQHLDLVDNLWDDGMGNHGYDFINMDADPDDDEGHGTHVAGTIGARGNNAIGTTGVCWRVKLMAVKVLDADGIGYSSSIVQGLNYARTNGADVINMSLGGTGTPDAAYRTAIENVSNNDILLVVAAGNSNANAGATYPCAFQVSNLICVGAVDQNFSRADFSNYSTTYVHIGAPGTNILSSALGTISDQVISTDSTNWTVVGDWNSTPSVQLQSPATYDGTSVRSVRNSSNSIYRSFDFTNAARAYATFTFSISVDATDLFAVLSSNSSGTNPSADAGAEVLGAASGTAAGITRSLEIFNCRRSQCSLGFDLTTNDDDNLLYGVRITSLRIFSYEVGTSGHDTYNGTSMASPHVAGLAAMVKAYNPTFTAAEVRAAILNTGTRNANLTSYFQKGSVVNAPNALKYIPKPEAPVVAVQ